MSGYVNEKCDAWDMVNSDLSIHVILYQCTNIAINEAGKEQQEDPLEELK